MEPQHHNPAKNPIVVIIFFFLILFLYIKFAGPIPFSVNSVQTTKTNLFTVSASADLSQAPTTASVTLGITKTGTSVLSIQKDANAVANKLTADLKKLGVKESDIKTTSYNVSPNTDFGPNAKTSNGYTINQSIEVKVTPIDLANQVVDTATKDGANVVNGISFTFDDATQQKLEDQVRKEAIDKAKAKAQSLANAAGIHLGNIIDVQEGNNSPQPVFKTMAPQDAAANLNTQTSINPGENTITSTVTLSYETF